MRFQSREVWAWALVTEVVDIYKETLERVPLGRSGSGSVSRDHSDHDVSTDGTDVSTRGKDSLETFRFEDENHYEYKI